MIHRLLLSFLITMICSSYLHASSVELEWDPNTESDIGGYKIYYSIGLFNTNETIVVDVGNVTTTSITGLDPTKAYCFAATAYDTSGNESAFSNVVCINELVPPNINIKLKTPVINEDGSVEFIVNSSDDTGVERLEIYINGVINETILKPESNISRRSQPLASGIHQIKVIARDGSGNTQVITKNIIVKEIVLGSQN